jgi:signal transduction histidine kinase
MSDRQEKTATLLHDAAHDLNNVMMTIAGSAELLLEGAGDNQQLREWVQHVLNALQEGIALVNDLKSEAISMESTDGAHEGHLGPI